MNEPINSNNSHDLNSFNNQSIFLVGFMGSGKTTIGAALATQLAREFIDLDALIVAEVNCPISEIFARHGESYFRALERDALQRLAACTGFVIALGGGAFVAPENREIVRAQGLSIWLDCALTEILRRLTNGNADSNDNSKEQTRPLFRSPTQMAELLAARQSAYQEADLRIDVTMASVDQIVSEIVGKLASFK